MLMQKVVIFLIIKNQFVVSAFVAFALAIYEEDAVYVMQGG
jgi:hypothetical protein